jgi:hypothetical protein
MPRQAPEQPTDPGNRGSAAAQRERKHRLPNPCTTATISTKTRKATGSMPKAKLSDCKKNMRMVGFRQEQRSQLEKYCSDTKPVALLNCEVKQARQSEELEVVMKSGTRVEASPQKFEVPGDLLLDATSEMTLNGLERKIC